MRESFLDYSMSVIVQRALPDVRDGLKPVHRRILHAMHELGLRPERPYKKCATVVGDVLGKYHPHGDAAVYDALVRMVQDFSLRYPLVDGQGNFGSLDGDPAAAYRYTEARLAPVALELLDDIDKDTVAFLPNFDDRLEEPAVLPARLPNLLVNGSSGIAVGMSTNIPPHNLGEVVAAAMHLLDHPECRLEELMEHLPGPDFPTGGIVVGREGIRQAYRTGRGKLVLRARLVRERMRGGKDRLVVTEVPYGSNKARLMEQIAALVKRGKTPEVAHLGDESDRDGVRVVIELKKGADPSAVVAALYRWTGLQTTFGVISLALDKGVPRQLTLKEVLERYRDHRVEVVVRRSRWELARSRDELLVLAGLLAALERIGEVVALIRASRDREQAATGLREMLDLSEPQAAAILRMPLSRLTALESAEMQARSAALEQRAVELERLLAHPELQLAEVRRELRELAERHGDERRTAIEEDPDAALKQVAAEERMVLAVSHQGYIKKMPASLYRRRVGTGRPLADMEKYGEDFLHRVFMAGSGDTVLVFSEDGRAYGLAVEEVPESGRGSRGPALRRLLGLPPGSRVVAVLPLPVEASGKRVVFATSRGVVKRTPLDRFASPRSRGVAAIQLQEGERLIAARLSAGEGDVLLVTRLGRAIRFSESEVNELERAARGVRGVRLGDGDRVVAAPPAWAEGFLCTVTERGFAKKTPLSGFPVQGRGGLGRAAHDLNGDTGWLAGGVVCQPGDELMLVAAEGAPRPLPEPGVPLGERGGRGRRVVELDPGDRVVGLARVPAGR